MNSSDLLEQIEGFLIESGMSASTFGRRALNDWRFVRDLRAGNRRVWSDTADRVMAFIAASREQAAGQSESAS